MTPENRVDGLAVEIMSELGIPKVDEGTRDWLRTTLHQQLQKTREQTNQKWLSAIDEEIDDMNAQGSVFEEMTDRITSIALAHSKLDHLPDRPLNSERE